MFVTHALEEVPFSAASHVTVGAFDGVHRGHQHLIGSMARSAHAAGRVAAAVTFDPHPGAVLGRRPVASLSSPQERVALMAEIGVDALVVIPFTPSVAGTPAEKFISNLMRHLDMMELWVGPDFALGHRREGDISFLREHSLEMEYTVHVVEPLEWEGKPVSSTRIRAALTAGDVQEANGCLGRLYRLAGTVVPGSRRGHEMGFPTANLVPPSGRLVPANGVYAGWGQTEEGRLRPAVINVGVRPTVGPEELTLEAHLLDFERELYDQHLALHFVSRVRDERRFPDLDRLADQIKQDISYTRRILASYSEKGEWVALGVSPGTPTGVPLSRTYSPEE